MINHFLRRVQAIAFIFLAVGGLLLASCSSNAPSSNSNISNNSHPATPETASGVYGGVLFGGVAPLVAQESTLGRKVAIIRTYYGINSQGVTAKGALTNFPTAADAQIMAGGRTLLVSFGMYQWADIAAGKLDAVITSALIKVNQAAITYHLNSIYVCFEHEPDWKTGKLMGQVTGTPKDFVAAWRHIYQLASAQHLNWQNGGHLHWVLILLQEAFPKRAALFWPGSDVVDILGDDVYTTLHCSATSVIGSQVVAPAELLNPALKWAAQHAPGIPVFIPEWGMPSQSAATRPAFIEAMTRFIDNHPEIQAEMYFDDPGQQLCHFPIDGDAASLAAMAAMGKDAHFQGYI